MRRRLYSLMAAALCTAANAQYQFPNSDFEDEFVTAYVSKSYTEPLGWHGYATIDASSLNNTGRSGSKLCASDEVRDGASGSQCVYIASTSILGVIANGVMTNGQIYTHSTTATDGTQNYNFSDPDNTGSEDTYGENNKFFTEFIGRPDSVRVWVKFVPAGSGQGNANMSIYTHKAGTVMYDPTDNVTDHSIIVAHANQSIPECDWQQLSVPFVYSSSEAPGLILATFTTNETAGGGTSGDKLYIDDIEMVYVSTLTTATYDGNTIDFTDGMGTVDALYNARLMKYASGVGAVIATEDPTEDNDYTLTLTITSNDLLTTNVYQVQFSGLAGDADDEADATITVPEITLGTLTEGGTYYLRNAYTGGYLTASDNLSDEPQTVWTYTNGTIVSSEGTYIQVDRSSYSSTFDSSLIPVTSSATANSNSLNIVESDGFIEIYRKNLKYYQGGTFNATKYYSNIFVGAESNEALTAYYVGQYSDGGCSITSYADYNEEDATKTQWQLLSPMNIFLHNIAADAEGASLSAGNTYDLTTLGLTADTEIDGLPLGLYSVDGGEVTYLPNGESMTLTAQNTTLTYYGRLSLTAQVTYNGAEVTDGSAVDIAYDESLLTATATGNGTQTVSTYYDEDTNELLITLAGYGRSKELVVTFAALDLGLYATYGDVELTDGMQIEGVYDEAQLTVTAANGSVATYEAAATDELNTTLTITVTFASQSATYTVLFYQEPEPDGIKAATAATAATVYTIGGQRVSKPARGLYIVDGKKTVIR